MLKILFTHLLISSASIGVSIAQATISTISAPSDLLLKVKNFEEFTGRFNYTLDINGNPIRPGSTQEYSRTEYVEMLFDLADPRFSPNHVQHAAYTSKKDAFIQQVLNNKLKIQKDTSLYCIVNSIFSLGGKDIEVKLTMQYAYDGDNAWRWALINAESEKLSISDTYKKDAFIAPHSDYLDFQNLDKVLHKNAYVKNLTSEKYIYKQLPVFLYLVENGRLSFKHTVKNTYVYTGIEGWKVFISDFNRAELNTGWLISDIVQTVIH